MNNFNLAEISDPSHHPSLMTSLRQFLSTDSLVDIQFVCQGGQKVFAHKLLLLPISNLLTRLLMENPDTHEMVTIHLPDISSKLLRIVINFLYIGSTRLNHNEMEQFKLVLKLLDIELFAKPGVTESSSRQAVVNLPPSNANLYNSNVSSNVVNGVPMPTVSNVYVQRNVPGAQATTSHATSVPVDSKPPMQQYIQIQADQLKSSSNPGQVLIPLSAVPGLYENNSGVVGEQNLTPLQIKQPEGNKYVYSGNVGTGPVRVYNSNTMMQPQVESISVAPMPSTVVLKSGPVPTQQATIIQPTLTNCVQPLQQNLQYNTTIQSLPDVNNDQGPSTSLPNSTKLTIHSPLQSVEVSVKQEPSHVKNTLSVTEAVNGEGVSNRKCMIGAKKMQQKNGTTFIKQRLITRNIKRKGVKRKCPRVPPSTTTITEIIDLSDEESGSNQHNIINVISLRDQLKSTNKRKKYKPRILSESSFKSDIERQEVDNDAVIEIDQ